MKRFNYPHRSAASLRVRQYNVIGIDTGSEEEEEEQIDYSNATLRIVSTSGPLYL